jgi:hypothetical protein
MTGGPPATNGTRAAHAKVCSNQVQRSPGLQRLVRDLSGRSLAAAEAAVGQLATFERETTAE